VIVQKGDQIDRVIAMKVAQIVLMTDLKNWEIVLTDLTNVPIDLMIEIARFEKKDLQSTNVQTI
jgi:hypothetical protein